MSELVANAVEHSRASEGEPVSVLVARQRDGVRLEVTDGGSGFEPTGRRPAGNQRGYGLFLVDQLTNRWGVERGPGARVWCELDVLAGDLAR
jgi:anti-sigma regulatory factor (Ser/Thr protein kinase)